MFDPSTIEEATKELCSLAPFANCEEAFSRSVMNRAYYCAYGSLRMAIENKHPGVFGKMGRHGILCRSLTEAKDTLFRSIGVRLVNLRLFREWADYEYDNGCSTTQAELCLNKCSKVLEKLDRLTDGQRDGLADEFKRLIDGL